MNQREFDSLLKEQSEKMALSAILAENARKYVSPEAERRLADFAASHNQNMVALRIESCRAVHQKKSNSKIKAVGSFKITGGYVPGRTRNGE